MWNLVTGSRLLAKHALRSFTRGYKQAGIPGSSTPIPCGKPMLLTAVFILFFGVGSTAPFLVVRLHYYKKNLQSYE